MRVERLTPPLLLASGSPRRRQLLADAGFDFEVAVSGADESFDPQLPLSEVPLVLARHKAQALAARADTHLVIAADTVVILGDEILNKPLDAVDAERMLARLSGHTHTVITGVCLSHRGQTHSFAERTDVTFRPLDADEIAHYVATYLPLDKAGAYGVQEYIGLRAVARIQGDFYNVMGLPVCRLVDELAHFVASHPQP